MGKKYWLLLSFISFFCLAWSSGKLYYSRPGDQISLNPALPDSTLSFSAKFYHQNDQLSDYRLAWSTHKKNSGLAASLDYLYLSFYKKMTSQLSFYQRNNYLFLGTSLIYTEDSQDQAQQDYRLSLGSSYQSLQAYLICTSAENKQWAGEFRYHNLLVFRWEEADYLLASHLPLSKAVSFKVGVRKKSISPTLVYRQKNWFAQLSSVHHRHLAPDFSFSLGLNL